MRTRIQDPFGRGDKPRPTRLDFEDLEKPDTEKALSAIDEAKADQWEEVSLVEAIFGRCDCGW